MKNATVQTVKEFIRQPYAWPGGYPLILVMSDGGTLCADCAKSEFRLIVRSTKDAAHDGWQAEGVQPHMEGAPVSCDHCNKEIASAYGDPFTFEYYINLDERGEFSADVRNAEGETVWEIASAEALSELVEDGFIKHGRDLDGILKHLKSLDLVCSSATLTKAN